MGIHVSIVTYWSRFHSYFPGLLGSDLLARGARRFLDAVKSFALSLQRTGGILHCLESSKGQLCCLTNSEQQDHNFAVHYERLQPG